MRRWRQTHGRSTAQLAARVFVSRELLQKVETAHRNASADLIAACGLVLDTGGTLARLLEFAVYQEGEHAQQANTAAAGMPTASPPAPMTPVSIRFTVTAELVPPDEYDGEADRTVTTEAQAVGARIYQFPSSRSRGRR